MKTNVNTTGYAQMGKTVAVTFNKDNYEAEVELQLGDYEIEIRDGKTYAVLKKPIYPKTYKECCDALSIAPYYNLRFYTYEHGYNEYATTNSLLSLEDKLNRLGKLIICRDAYWKMLGEEMGLDKPWEPAMQDTIWGITRSKDEVEKYSCHYGKTNPLEFPTAEMRDAFYENFKDMIEQCKELL